MNDTNQDSTPESVVTAAAKPVVKSPSRRRLIKLGTAGVPVVATLASSPAMAWHCRTASAWGSNMDDTNLTASQKTNPAHDPTVDECWAISNWCNNTARTNTGITSKPWDALKGKCGNLYNNVPAKDPKTNKIIAAADKYKYVTVDSLVSACAIIKPSGCSGSSKVVDVMNTGDDFSRCIIVAQLNYLFPTNANKIQWCAKDAKGANQLPKMATGSYQPNGIGAAWDKAKIVKYLRNNYMSV